MRGIKKVVNERPLFGIKNLLFIPSAGLPLTTFEVVLTSEFI
jgi:hypothetical protein